MVKEMTDEEISVRYNVPLGSPHIENMRRMSMHWVHKTNNTLPSVKCPHCLAEYEMSDPSEFRVGDAMICVNCERRMHIIKKDVVITFTLSTKEAV